MLLPFFQREVPQGEGLSFSITGEGILTVEIYSGTKKNNFIV